VLSLLSAEYHAFAFDQRGHGNSDKPECCYTGDDYAADVDAFMDAVGIEKATLVGDSSGGMIAQRVALDYPQRVSRLVLIGSPTTLVNNETVMGSDLAVMSGTYGGTNAVRETVALAGRRGEHGVCDGRIGGRICAMRAAFFRVEWLR
jgi:pimeloyl-ACP methyl ester carboxylesterase